MGLDLSHVLHAGKGLGFAQPTPARGVPRLGAFPVSGRLARRKPLLRPGFAKATLGDEG